MRFPEASSFWRRGEAVARPRGSRVRFDFGWSLSRAIPWFIETGLCFFGSMERFRWDIWTWFFDPPFTRNWSSQSDLSRICALTFGPAPVYRDHPGIYRDHPGHLRQIQDRSSCFSHPSKDAQKCVKPGDCRWYLDIIEYKFNFLRSIQWHVSRFNIYFGVAIVLCSSVIWCHAHWKCWTVCLLIVYSAYEWIWMVRMHTLIYDINIYTIHTHYLTIHYCL